MPKYRYVGVLTKIITRLDNVERAMDVGEVVDVSEAQAEILDLTPANWEKVETRTASAPPPPPPTGRAQPPQQKEGD